MKKTKKNQYYDMDADFALFSKRITKIFTLSIIGIVSFVIGLGLLARLIFKEPRFDKYTSIIVSKFLWWDIAMLIIALALTIASAVFIFRAVKKKASTKWAHIIWVALLVICGFQAKYVSDVVLDIKNESYVVYQGEFTQDNSGNTRFRARTTRLMPDDIRLKSRESLIDSGDYVGTIIYTKRSEIAIEVKDVDLKSSPN